MTVQIQDEKLIGDIFKLIDYIRCIETMTGCKTINRPNIDYISLRLMKVRREGNEKAK